MLLVAFLLMLIGAHECEGKNTRYTITVKTGSKSYAGSTSQVWVQLFGVNGNTGWIHLTGVKDAFLRSKESTFHPHTKDVGKLVKIWVYKDYSDKFDRWNPDYITVVGREGCRTMFHLHRRFSPNYYSMEVYPEFDRNSCGKILPKYRTYMITVRTYSLKYPSVYVRAYIALNGKSGSTGYIRLMNKYGSFGAKHITTYVIHAPDVGDDIITVRLRYYDLRGSDGAWKPTSIIVRPKSDRNSCGQHFLFMAWIERMTTTLVRPKTTDPRRMHCNQI